MALIRHNFHNESEALINKQINMELQASYVYRSMVRRKKLLLKGFIKFSFFNVRLPFLTEMTKLCMALLISLKSNLRRRANMLTT